MAFDNYYPKRKDFKRVFNRARRADRIKATVRGCRNGGSCDHCRRNRMIGALRLKALLLTHDEVHDLKIK